MCPASTIFHGAVPVVSERLGHAVLMCAEQHVLLMTAAVAPSSWLQCKGYSFHTECVCVCVCVRLMLMTLRASESALHDCTSCSGLVMSGFALSYGVGMLPAVIALSLWPCWCCRLEFLGLCFL